MTALCILQLAGACVHQVPDPDFGPAPPQSYGIEDISCDLDDSGHVVYRGRLTNRDGRSRGWSVLVRYLDRDGKSIEPFDTPVLLGSLEPGESEIIQGVSMSRSAGPVRCEVSEVELRGR